MRKRATLHMYGLATNQGLARQPQVSQETNVWISKIDVCDRSTSAIECFVKEPSAIRLLTDGDVGAALALQQLEGWNQTVRDWCRLLQLAPTGCFAAEVDGRLSGTVT